MSVGSDKQLRGDDGWKNLTDKLKVIWKNERATKNECIRKFCTLVRPANITILEYINKFDELHQKVQNHGTTLPDCVLKYYFLKNTNIPTDKSDLV